MISTYPSSRYRGLIVLKTFKETHVDDILTVGWKSVDSKSCEIGELGCQTLMYKNVILCRYHKK